MSNSHSACYCIGLRRAANALTARYDRILQPIGLTVNQFSLLGSLDTLGGCSIQELASYVGLERTTLSRTLRPLMQRGLIADSAAAAQRSRRLQLTPAGHALLQQGLPLWQRAQREVEDLLGPEQARRLRSLADQL